MFWDSEVLGFWVFWCSDLMGFLDFGVQFCGSGSRGSEVLEFWVLCSGIQSSGVLRFWHSRIQGSGVLRLRGHDIVEFMSSEALEFLGMVLGPWAAGLLGC
jgi:hypothetical protein